MKKFLIYLLPVVFIVQSCMAQQPKDSILFPIKKEYAVDSVPHLYRTKLFPSMIIPGILIGYGLTTLKNHGLYSSYQAQKDIQKALGTRRSHVDDYLQYAPYAEFGALLLLRVKCKNDALNTALLIGKSELLMSAIVLPLKSITKEERPDSTNKFSFPSGHTAEAFLAATIVYREYRYKSSWYGIGAYALATTVGVYRMINNKHWESDVLVGAGIGMLSANLVYATHLHRWGRKEVCLVPMYDGTSKGFLMSYSF
jgi:hypothetical protein